MRTVLSHTVPGDEGQLAQHGCLRTATCQELKPTHGFYALALRGAGMYSKPVTTFTSMSSLYSTVSLGSRWEASLASRTPTAWHLPFSIYNTGMTRSLPLPSVWVKSAGSCRALD